MDLQPDLEAAHEQRQAYQEKLLYTTAPSWLTLPNDRPGTAAQASSSDEQHQLFATWQSTQHPYSAIPYMHTLFEQQVAQNPDALALTFEEQSLTYAALNHDATRLACLLQAAGVGPEVLVALYLERSLQMVIALLAVLKAGGAYVPLDSAAPQERLAFILRDCAAPIVLTQSQMQAGLPAEYGGRIVVLEDQLDNASTLLPWTGAALQAANLLYTSGSTGQPKGVVNTHQGLYNRLFWMQDHYHLQRSDRVLQKTPYSFDVSVWEVFWPLHVGATLVLARPDGHRDSAYLAGLMREQGISVAHFVPSMLHIFLEEPSLTQCEALRYVLCSGEVLSVELQQRCFACLGAELHNLYGPTEAAIDVTAWACVCGSTLSTVPIGRPIYNTQIVLLDPNGMLVPPGEPGELCIGGMGLARGYYQRPDLTAERFLPHLYSPESGARLYQTGDLARELSDGNFEFLGRLDHQVKLRGQRIELGEIEFSLDQYPEVRACLVQVQTFAENDQRLVAYLIPQAEQKPTPKELRGFLRLSLPEYMIPSTFIYLDSWPLLSNGKINRRALPPAPFAKAAVKQQSATIHQVSDARSDQRNER